MKHYQLVMAGSRGDLTSAQGQCRPTQTWRGGGYVWHYMDCDFLYSDGFSEHVFIPWPQHYSPGDDPADHPYKSYAVEDPPADFALPHPFASRAWSASSTGTSAKQSSSASAPEATRPTQRRSDCAQTRRRV